MSSEPPEPVEPSELESILQMVSVDTLDGRPIPADLALLWKAQLDGETDLLDAFELVLLDSMTSDDALEGFGINDGVEPAAAKALASVVSTIGFVAEALDGALLGYWFGSTATLPPVVLFDGNGQLELLGATMAEALIALSDPEDDEEVAEVVAGLEALGIVPQATNHDGVLDRLAGIAGPNELVLTALIEARMQK